MSRRSGLGKGLGALIPEGADPERVAEPRDDGNDAGRVMDLPIDRVSPNPHQPRRHFDGSALEGLAASIAEVGVLQPVLVRRVGDDWELVAGERRWRATRLAGRQTIPAIERRVDDLGSLEQAIVENLHRADLNPLEEAAALAELVSDFGYTHDQVAQRVGRSRPAVGNLLRLLQLPAPVQAMVRDGLLSAGHARAVLAAEGEAAQTAFARRIVSKKLSVRDAEEAARSEKSPGRPTSSASRNPNALPTGDRPAGVVELENLLAERLDTRVHVDLSARRGRVVIEFADLDDLERIYRQIVDDET